MGKYTFGFLGAGNMGGALAQAACRGVGADRVVIADKSAQRAESFSKELGCQWAANEIVAREADYLFLGVKPQMMADLLSEIAPVLAARQDRFVLVSMAAGLTMARLLELLGASYPIIRIMPNTAASVGQAMVLYDLGGSATQEDADDFTAKMEKAGRFDRLQEHLIDAGSCVSGCGPAFACLFLEALADGGVSLGLPRDKAMTYAAQMLLGTATMALESGKHPGVLKDMVCSPGGTTIQGVRALEAGGFRSAVFEAVTAAYDKTAELAK